MLRRFVFVKGRRFGDLPDFRGGPSLVLGGKVRGDRTSTGYWGPRPSRVEFSRFSTTATGALSEFRSGWNPCSMTTSHVRSCIRSRAGSSETPFTRK